MGVKPEDARNPPTGQSAGQPGETLPKGKESGQDKARKVPQRWQKTERASRAWREVESRTGGKK